MGLWTRLLSARGLLRGISQSDLHPDPVVQFDRWYRFARRARVYLPNAMALATASDTFRPSARMMLLKGWDARGFVFFTNYESRKGEELETNARVALVFHWSELHRQIRVEGWAARVSQEESETYFHSRPRGSQIGAWASRQSEPIRDRRELRRSYQDFSRKFMSSAVPLPPFWGGYRVTPERMEFWQGRAHRLHDRLCYVRDGEAWKIVRLSP
jgi:pyridoxamine 5'-phosphate oxidase